MIKGKFIGLRAVEKEDLKYLRDWRNLTEFRKTFSYFFIIHIHSFYIRIRIFINSSSCSICCAIRNFSKNNFSFFSLISCSFCICESSISAIFFNSSSPVVSFNIFFLIALLNFISAPKYGWPFASNDWNINVNSLTYFDIASDLDIGKVDENYLFKVLSQIDLKESDALFISCTALPALSIINQLEKKFNKLVLSSNQTLIWDSLNQINYKKKIEGFGKLFNI